MILNVQSLIRSWIRRDPIRFQGLHADMIASRSGITLEHYLQQAFLVSLGVGIIFAIGGFLFTLLFAVVRPSGQIGIYNVLNLPIPDVIGGISVFYFFQGFAVLVAFAFGAYLTYNLMLRMPGFAKSTRATKINMTIHNAVAYMYAMRRGGAQLMVIFRSLSENSNIYGEIALEFRQVVRDADFFGYDVVTALKHLTETTPSEKLKNFLEDLLSVIESGGDMSAFLSMRVRLYQEEARFEQKQFLNFLSMVAESYVTLFVAGPLFLIIIMVVMGMVGGSAILQFTAVTYAVLPVGSLVFILLIDMISIKGEHAERYHKAKWLHEYDEVPLVKQAGEEKLFAQLAKYDRWRDILHQLKHPLQGFVMNVNRSFFITVPVAILYVALIVFNTPYYADPEVFINVIDDHIIIAILIVLLPYGIFYEMWVRKILGLEDLIPDFLERMANINKVGLTISQTITILVNTNLGLLSYEIKRIKRDMDWGAHFTDALIRFEERISTPLIARTVTLITKAAEMSGQIGEVLTIAASDAKMSWILKRERMSDMFIYTAVVYLSFFVFLFVVAVLTSQFLPVLAKVSTSGSGTSMFSGTLSGVGSVSIATFRRLLYHSCLMQAFFSGIIAGQLGEGSVASGVKHACIMLGISLVAFNFFI